MFSDDLTEGHETMPRTRPVPDRLPPHPGGFVRSTIIRPLGLSVSDAARALGVHRVALSRLLNEQAALSPEMAIRLEKAFGADMEALMLMQSRYDIAQARAHQDKIKIGRYEPPTAAETQPKLI
jgi:antitoxin HigA-1